MKILSFIRGYLFSLSKKSGFNHFLSKLITQIYRNPSEHIKIIGVTGTNGKTTTAFLIQEALEHLGEKTGLIGTLYASFGSHKVETNLTTPKPITLNRLLVKMIKENCTYCVMEVSSIGLAENRVDGIKFKSAVFTNLMHDHLNFHKSMEAYSEAKARLFNSLDKNSYAILNKDDRYWPQMAKKSQGKIILYGDRSKKNLQSNFSKIPKFTFRVIKNSLGGLYLNLNGNHHHFKLLGHFNAYNITAAYSTLVMLGFENNMVIEALCKVQAPKGRFQVINKPGQESLPLVIVDYAHTPDALEKILMNVREMMSKNMELTIVFGCGGDRDRTKRAHMGSIAERCANNIILTSDNSRNEQTMDICNEIESGITDKKKYRIIINRKKAIKKAITESCPKTVILIAGKGHETYQEIRGKKYCHSDILFAEKELEKYSTKKSNQN